METKVCTKCGPPAQPIENFHFKDRTRGIRHGTCKSCQNEYVRAHYKANRPYYLKKARLRNAEQNRINADFSIDYREHHPCVDCGDSDIAVLQFDHRADKVLSVSVLSREGYSLEKVKREIAKCEVVCANCHTRRTAKQFGWYRLKQLGLMRP
jgi:hypothetical protein